jgi:hypothetical protein
MCVLAEEARSLDDKPIAVQHPHREHASPRDVTDGPGHDEAGETVRRQRGGIAAMVTARASTLSRRVAAVKR